MKLSDSGEREFVIMLGGTIASAIGCGVAYDLGAKGTSAALAVVTILAGAVAYAIVVAMAEIAREGKS